VDPIIAALPTLDRLGAVAMLILFAWLIFSERLISRKRFDKMQADRDRWQMIAVEALTGPAQAGVRAAEVAATVVSSLPDPQAVGKD
jgi:hypothetical protein